MPATLVRPLEADWKDLLDRVLRARGWSIDDIGRLAPRVAELSRAYNEGAAEGKRTKLPLEARIAFSFPRDVPKGAAAVRELVALGLLAKPLRVLDLGAGLGAMTWGVARALGGPEGIEAVLVDEDPDVLAAAAEIARAGGLRAITRVSGVADLVADRPKADLVILGQVLSELDPHADAARRLDAHVQLVERLLETAVAPNGSLLIVEPALRDRTRHLHALRDRVASFVVAPCLHQGPCPALATEGDWCHEDLAGVDLPSFVAPLARAAGLRWQGLTFSYLVLRRDPPAPAPVPGRVRFRVTSDLLRSKGKVELFACCEDGRRPRIRRLERDGPLFDELQRGDIVSLAGDPPIDDRGRVAKHAAIDVGPGRQ